MIDHIGIKTPQFEAMVSFYRQALAPLGYAHFIRLPLAFTQGVKVGGFGNERPHFWIEEAAVRPEPIHVAFTANSRKHVHAFFEAALKAGAQSNGDPGLRPHYHADYYGAFVIDPDGNNVEAVCHIPHDKSPQA